MSVFAVARWSRARRRLAAVGGALILFGMTGGSARAQVSIAAYDTTGSAAGVSLIYEQPSFGIPTGGEPPLVMHVPYTQVESEAGPTGHSVASMAWPGDFIANAPPMASDELQASGVPVPDFPVYPVRAESFYPTGPTRDESAIGPMTMTSSAVQGASQASAWATSVVLPGILDIGEMRSLSEGSIQEEGGVSESSVALKDVDFFEGMIHFDTVKTTVRVVSDGTTATTSGSTVYAGLLVLGQPATVDADGIHFSPAPEEISPTPTPTPSPTGTGALPVPGQNLGGRSAPKAAASPTPTPSPPPSPTPTPEDGPLGEILNPIFEQATESAGGALKPLGIEMSLPDPIVMTEGAEGSREQSGIVITIKGETLQPIVDALPDRIEQEIETRIVFDQTISLIVASASVSASASLPPELPTTPPVSPVLPGAGGPPFGFDGTFPPTSQPGTTGGLVPTGSRLVASGLPITALLLGLAMGLAAVGAGGLRRFAEAATTAPLAVPCPLEKPQT